MFTGIWAMAMMANPLAIHVSPTGDDASVGSSRKPFRTLARVQQALKELDPNQRKAGVSVVLKGTFYLPKTVVFGAEATGVTFRGAKGGAVLSGGDPLSGWRSDNYNGVPALSVAIPGRTSMQLFEEGGRKRRLTRPRFPSQGYLQVGELPPGAKEGEWNKGQNWFRFRGDDIRKFKNLNEVEVVVHHYWVTSRLPIANVDPASRTVNLSKTSVWRLTDDYSGEGAPYWLDNVGEALSRPGEFYFDRAGGKLLALPHGSVSADKARFVAPRLSTLLRFEGASDVHLEGIHFAHTEFVYPADKSGDYQAAFSVPGAVQVSGGKGFRMEGCVFRNMGTYGLEITGEAKQAAVQKCDFRDLGAGGIKIDHGTSGASVEDCVIEDIGVLYPSAIGIWIGNSGQNRIAHNLIQRTGYTGVSLGWTWGYGPSNATGNVVEDNIIRDIGQNLLSDMGGIYNLGVSPGTVFRRNYIADVKSRGYGGWGIYLDEGSSQVLVENNVVERTTTGGFHQHYGRENTIRNNVFAFSGRDGQVIRSRKEDHLSFTFKNNLVVWKPGVNLLGGGGKTYEQVTFVENLLWQTDGKGALPEGLPKSNRIADVGATFGIQGLSLRESNGLPIQPFSLKGVGPRR